MNIHGKRTFATCPRCNVRTLKNSLASLEYVAYARTYDPNAVHACCFNPLSLATIVSQAN